MLAYFYPNASCSASTCELGVGYVSSVDGGTTWSTAQTLASSMSLAWLAGTNRRVMVGDYISTSIAAGKAFPLFAVATARHTGYDEDRNDQRRARGGWVNCATSAIAVRVAAPVPLHALQQCEREHDQHRTDHGPQRLAGHERPADQTDALPDPHEPDQHQDDGDDDSGPHTRRVSRALRAAVDADLTNVNGALVQYKIPNG